MAMPKPIGDYATIDYLLNTRNQLDYMQIQSATGLLHNVHTLHGVTLAELVDIPVDNPEKALDYSRSGIYRFLSGIRKIEIQAPLKSIGRIKALDGDFVEVHGSLFRGFLHNSLLLLDVKRKSTAQYDDEIAYSPITL